MLILFFTSRRRHTRLQGDWSSDVCSSDLLPAPGCGAGPEHRGRERGERHGIALAITGGAVARGAGCPGPGGSDRRDPEKRVGGRGERPGPGGCLGGGGGGGGGGGARLPGGGPGASSPRDWGP